MSPAVHPVIATLTPMEKLELVGELWDQVAASGVAFDLIPAQQAELRAERELIRQNPQDGSPWTEVKARLLGKK